jgi:hypothetical protein
MPPARSGVLMASSGRKYGLIWNAVLARASLSAWYEGHLRIFSPFVLGTKAGDPHVLGYQFDGTSHEPLGPEGSPENWRCFRVAELTKVKPFPGDWHATGRGKGFQHLHRSSERLGSSAVLHQASASSRRVVGTFVALARSPTAAPQAGRTALPPVFAAAHCRHPQARPLSMLHGRMLGINQRPALKVSQNGRAATRLFAGR